MRLRSIATATIDRSIGSRVSIGDILVVFSRRNGGGVQVHFGPGGVNPEARLAWMLSLNVDTCVDFG